LLYRLTITRTIILGGENLDALPPRVILAGTHRSFPDTSLVRYALSRSAARGLANRLVVAIGGEGFLDAGYYSALGILTFGLYPLRQHGEREAGLRGLVRAAAAGNAVLIYPQGTHATIERECAGDPAVRFRPGVAHLAAALDAAVVTFGLAGTEAIMPPRVPEGFRGLVLAGIPVALRRGPLAIAFGAPLRLAPGESPQAFAARLQDTCYALARRAEQALSQESGRLMRSTPSW
jgi:1-acyl-sn-glycerol-3-phosphate acyltransferase